MLTSIKLFYYSYSFLVLASIPFAIFRNPTASENIHGDTKHPDNHILYGALHSPDPEVDVDNIVVEFS